MNVSKGETKAILTDILEKAKKTKILKRLQKINLMRKTIKQLDDILKEVKDTDKAEFPSVKSVIWEDDNQILKRNLTMKDEDGSTVKLNGTSQVDDDNLMIDYKLTTDDDQEVALKGKSTKKTISIKITTK